MIFIFLCINAELKRIHLEALRRELWQSEVQVTLGTSGRGGLWGDQGERGPLGLWWWRSRAKSMGCVHCELGGPQTVYQKRERREGGRNRPRTIRQSTGTVDGARETPLRRFQEGREKVGVREPALNGTDFQHRQQLVVIMVHIPGPSTCAERQIQATPWESGCSNGHFMLGVVRLRRDSTHLQTPLPPPTAGKGHTSWSHTCHWGPHRLMLQEAV